MHSPFCLPPLLLPKQTEGLRKNEAAGADQGDPRAFFRRQKRGPHIVYLKASLPLRAENRVRDDETN